MAWRWGKHCAVKNYGDVDKATVYVPSLELLEEIKQAFELAKIPCAPYSNIPSL